MMRNVLFIFQFLAWGMSVLSSAQVATDYQMEQLTVANGLSNNTVRCIYQDETGYVWLGTPNGLNRYDGYSFVVYRPGQSEYGTSIGDARIRTIREDHQGLLWVQTTTAWECYDPHTMRFLDFTADKSHHRHDNNAFFADSLVWLWGTKGCLSTHYGDSQFTTDEYSVKNGQLPDDNVNFIFSKGRKTWISTAKGLILLSDGMSQVLAKDKNILTYLETDGKLLLTTSQGQRFILDMNSDKLTSIPFATSGRVTAEYVYGNCWYVHTPSATLAFSLQTLASTAVEPPLNLPGTSSLLDNEGRIWLYDHTGMLTLVDDKQGTIGKVRVMDEWMARTATEQYCIWQDSRGMIWIATNGQGLVAYSPTLDKTTHFTSLADSPITLPSNTLKYVMEDRSGCLWVGNEYTGVTLLKPFNNSWISYRRVGGWQTEASNANFIRLLAQHDGHVVVGNRNSQLFSLDTSLQTAIDSVSLDGNPYCMAIDKKDRTWIGTKGAGVYVDGTQYRHDPDNPHSLADNQIYSMVNDEKDNMWLATFGYGIDCATIHADGSILFRHFFRQRQGNDFVRSLCKDHEGWIWAATGNGVYRFLPSRLLADSTDYQLLNVENGLLRSDETRHIFCDSQGRVWISETGEGLALCDVTSKGLQVKHYGVAQGLANPMVQAFAEDRLGHVWVSTEYGLTRIRQKDMRMENFIPSKTILKNVFSENSALTISDGRILLGTNDGLAIVSPDQVESRQRKPQVVFTSLKVNGKWLMPDEDNRAVSFAERVRLTANQNSFEIAFSAFDYASIGQVKYSYKLDGYEQMWSEPSTLNSAAYKNLSPGTYTLYVKAYDETGVWSEPKALEIIVIRPLWLRWWAFLLYALAAFLIFLLVRWQLRKTNMLESTINMLNEQKEKMRMVFNREARTEKEDEGEDSAKAFLNRLDEIVDAELANPDFNAEDFAAKMGMGRTLFFRRTKEITGFTPKEYLRTIRMKRAAGMLSNPDINVSEVAFKVGINDPYYFSRCFKQQFGVTPSAYQKSRQERGGRRRT